MSLCLFTISEPDGVVDHSRGHLVPVTSDARPQDRSKTRTGVDDSGAPRHRADCGADVAADEFIRRFGARAHHRRPGKHTANTPAARKRKKLARSRGESV